MTSNTYKEPEVKEEQVPVKKTPKKKRMRNPLFKGIQSVMDGTILTRDVVVKGLPFVFYITLLAILYIANSYYAEKKIIEIEKVKKELKVLRSENIAAQSKLMYYSRQSEVIKRIEPYGIKESLIPPRKIIAEKDTTKKKAKRN